MRKVVCEIASQSHITEDSLTPLDMFRHGQALKSVILCFAWIMTCVSFYALGLNSSDLSGNIIMNFFLARLVGIGDGGYVLLTANYIGRRRSLGIAHFILGTSCLVLAFIPKVYSSSILGIYLL